MHCVLYLLQARKADLAPRYATSGKYNDGIPPGSRFDTNQAFFKDSAARLQAEEGKKEIEKVKKLTKLAEDPRLSCTVGQLALAWAASNPNVSTVILGATKPDQLQENFGALKVCIKLVPLFSNSDMESDLKFDHVDNGQDHT